MDIHISNILKVKMNIVQSTKITTLLLDYKFAPVGLLVAKDAFTCFYANRMNAFDAEHNMFRKANEWFYGSPVLAEDHPHMASVDKYWPVPTILQSSTPYVYKKRKRVSLKEMCKVSNFTCQICHNQYDYKHLTREHILPKSLKGTSSLDNLTITCKKCNNAKRDLYPYVDKHGKELAPLFDNVFGKVVECYDRPEWGVFAQKRSHT